MTDRNIVLIHTDDTGRHLGCYGADVSTPKLDDLAASGTRFTNYFCLAPQCSPSRGSVYTGLYPHRNGLMGLAHRGWRFDEGTVTLPEILGENGYRTYLAGQQHVTEKTEAGAASLGYDEWYVDSELATDVATKSEEIIDAHDGDEPFFLSAGINETHRTLVEDLRRGFEHERYDPDDPAEITVPAFLPDEPSIREDLAAMHGMVKAVDDAVGRIVDAVEAAGITDETLVVFTTDHGIPFPRAKGMCYDAGLGIALVMDHPEIAAGTTHDELLSNVDLLPTLLEFAGVEPPGDIDGRSFYPLLTGGEYDPRERIFFEITWHGGYNPIRGVRTTRHKYIRNFSLSPRVFLPTDVLGSKAGSETYVEHMTLKRPAEELYDLAADPQEQENLAPEWALHEGRPDDPGVEPEHMELLTDLEATLRAWMESTGDPLLDGPVPPVSNAEWP